MLFEQWSEGYCGGSDFSSDEYSRLNHARAQSTHVHTCTMTRLPNIGLFCFCWTLVRFVGGTKEEAATISSILQLSFHSGYESSIKDEDGGQSPKLMPGAQGK